MPVTPPQPFASTYFDSPYLDGDVIVDPTALGEFDYSNIAITPTTLSNANTGFAYTQMLTIDGGYAPYGNLTLTGLLPLGMTLSGTTQNLTSNIATANISGIPQEAGTFNFSITGNNVIGNSIPAQTLTTTQGYSLVVEYANITVSSSEIVDGIVGTAYSATVTATGGVTPYNWTEEHIPLGLSLTGSATVDSTVGTVTLSGIPSQQANTYNVTVAATDIYGATGNVTYSVNIAYPTITVEPSSISNAITGSLYSTTLTATGGVAPYTFSVTGNTVLPSDLALANATGVLSGVVTTSTGSPFSFQITAYDSYQSPSTPRTYSLVTTNPVVVISPTSFPTGTVGVPYTQILTSLSSGVDLGPYTYSLIGGTLPANLSLNSLGSVTGTPTTVGASSFTIESTDFFGTTGNFTYLNVNVVTPRILITPYVLSNVYVANAYDQTFTASGGTGPYTYEVTAGNVPSGLSFSNTGSLTGNTTVASTFDFTVTATDSYNTQGSRSYELEVLPPTIEISPTTIANATTTVSYTATFSASGATAPYTYAMSGMMPPGLSFNRTTGVLSGTPTLNGYYPFTITATDVHFYTGTQSYNFVVAEHIPDEVVRVYVGGILQTSGYSVIERNPVQIEFDVAPAANVKVGIVILQGNTWYDTTNYAPSNGLPLQLSTNPAAEFLKGQ